jgi:hypothetical protein
MQVAIRTEKRKVKVDEKHFREEYKSVLEP